MDACRNYGFMLFFLSFFWCSLFSLLFIFDIVLIVFHFLKNNGPLTRSPAVGWGRESFPVDFDSFPFVFDSFPMVFHSFYKFGF